MLAAIANLQTALAQRHAAQASSAIQDAKKQQEDFNAHILTDSGEVVSRLVATLGTELNSVLVRSSLAPCRPPGVTDS